MCKEIVLLRSDNDLSVPMETSSFTVLVDVLKAREQTLSEKKDLTRKERDELTLLHLMVQQAEEQLTEKW